MAKDYRVPHYKKDDVDHNSITIDTWQHQKEKLEPYLRHDCLSLLEVLDRHSTVIFNATYCEKHEWNKDECHTLNVLEELVMGSSFKKCRKLPWLKCPRDNKTKLELDGFDANLGLAVEVQSREHYKFNHFFHKNEDGFQLQQERDRAKLLACNNNNVHLIVVPYTVADSACYTSIPPQREYTSASTCSSIALNAMTSTALSVSGTYVTGRAPRTTRVQATARCAKSSACAATSRSAQGAR